MRHDITTNWPTNWVEQAALSLEPLLGASSTPQALYVSERLAFLLLERLPQPLALELVEMLPDSYRQKQPLDPANPDGDTSIGYPDFIERAMQAMIVSSCDPFHARQISQRLVEEMAKSAADTFLRGVYQVLPEELRERLCGSLPEDIKVHIDTSISYYVVARAA